jgi:hypothetical protein
MGMIFLAYAFSSSSPPSAKISKDTISRDINPSVSPENKPDNNKRNTAIIIFTVTFPKTLLVSSTTDHPELCVARKEGGG